MLSSEGQENSVSNSSIMKFDDEGDASRQHNPNFAVIERTLADVTKQQEELSTRMKQHQNIFEEIRQYEHHMRSNMNRL